MEHGIPKKLGLNDEITLRTLQSQPAGWNWFQGFMKGYVDVKVRQKACH